MSHTHLQQLERQAAALSPLHLSRSKKLRTKAMNEEAAIRQQIEMLVEPAPFAVRDNGVHFYYETDDLLVLRNHGSAYWSGMTKRGKSFQFVTSDFDPTTVLAQTKDALSL